MKHTLAIYNKGLGRGMHEKVARGPHKLCAPSTPCGCDWHAVLVARGHVSVTGAPSKMVQASVTDAALSPGEWGTRAAKRVCSQQGRSSRVAEETRRGPRRSPSAVDPRRRAQGLCIIMSSVVSIVRDGRGRKQRGWRDVYGQRKKV